MAQRGSSDRQYLTVWEFQVRPGSELEFERIYGPSGDWVKLFQTADGYIGTDLHRDLKVEGRYLTLDLWQSRQAYLDFRRTYAQQYAELDQRCEGLTERESAIGEFERVLPASAGLGPD